MKIENKDLKKDFHMKLVADSVIESADWDLDEISVNGRDGYLYLDKERYNSVPQSFVFYLMPPKTKTLEKTYDDFNDFISSKKSNFKFTLSNDPEHYYLGFKQKGLSFQKVGHRVAKVTMLLDVYPYKFLVSGDTAVSNPTSITNPTNYIAFPIIKVVASSANAYFTIAGRRFNLANTGTTTILIDSQSKKITNSTGSTSQWSQVATYSFPYIGAGYNSISKTNITTLEITPKYRRLI